MFLLLIGVLLLGCLAPGIGPLNWGSNRAVAQGPDAQQTDSKTFPSGHVVRGEFLEFYNSVDDPDRIFGLPISIEFDDPIQPGIRIQYFQRVRMDYDPSKTAGQRISLATLGEYAYDEARPGQPLPITTNNAMCLAFPNRKSVCYAFMQLYERYGEAYFGQPITNAEFAEDGRVVQYFERVRMEWRGELPVNKRVVISELGRFDFDKRIGNSTWLKPDSQQIPTQIKPSLYVFTARALVAGSKQNQQVFALIYDQYGKPIENVSINMKVVYPEGGPEPLNRKAEPTNELGYTMLDFAIADIAPNQVIQVVVEAEIANGPKTTASTWFRVWW